MPLAVLLGLYVTARLVILARYTVFTSVDSTSYADRPGNTIELLSFTGHAPRPWAVPLLYALAGSDRAGTVAQWGISTLAWSLLICACWLLLRTSFARIGAVSAVVGLALSRSVYSWDHAVLSESLSISLGIAALALLAIWVRSRSRVALGALVVAAVWWTFVRQDVLPYVLLLVVVLAGYALLRRYRRAAVVAVLALLAGLTWNVATVATVDESYRAWYNGLSLSEATFVYRLRFQVLNDPQVAKAYRDEFGMPHCQQAERIAGRPAWKMPDFFDAYEGCPDLIAWTQREKGSVAYRYALAHPRHAAAKTVETMPVLLGGTAGHYAEPVAAVPAFPERLIFPRPERVLLLAGLVAALAVAVGLLTRGFRRARWVAAAGGLLVLGSTASAVAGTLFTAGEYARFGIQEAVLLRVGLILLVAAAVDAATAAIRERTSTGRIDPGPEAGEPDGTPSPDDPTDAAAGHRGQEYVDRHA
ncbi:hypothetical protein GCE86_24635 [Micromonospora terminaliae]|uniref:Uncharacterized protein n=1 Tax=Micromonospora terminaliae TaxID=1914461 RepID=A0AAJ3DN35_9ACTN|nr:hypothetical protein [Micromonospora terminaliae]NES29900.1 hypothetical protein [Micromonospora terminaliae]QGL49925.1 hypothetical protein GCE86_24635 [Micromonospora terminaliae]